MWTVALSQLRAQPRRYVSLVLAILIGTMFLAASFLVSASAQATLRTTLGNTYSAADLVVLPEPSDHADEDPTAAFPGLAGTPAEPGALGRVDGVEEAYATQFTWAGGSAGGTEFTATLLPVPGDVSLLPVTLTEGAFPAADDARGVTLDTGTAERTGVAVGDEIALTGAPGAGGETATVVGLTTRSPDPTLSSGAQIWAAAPVIAAVNPRRTARPADPGPTRPTCCCA